MLPNGQGLIIITLSQQDYYRLPIIYVIVSVVIIGMAGIK